MAERRPPGFLIPLEFWNGPEVKSIPGRIRNTAIGVWARAGTYAAAMLTDGYVDAETLEAIGGGPAIRAALMATTGWNGEPDPLWIEAREGGIQFTKWSKYQRLRAEVKTYRESEAERKRLAREAKRSKLEPGTSTPWHGVPAPPGTPYQHPLEDFSSDLTNGSRPPVTSGDSETSARTTAGRPGFVRSTETETETETISTYVDHSPLRNVGADERGRSEPVAVSASRLVSTLIPRSTPAAVQTKLRLEASQLMVRDGLSSEVVAESLRRWQTKPDAGPGLLPFIASEVQREGTAPAPKSKQRDWATLAQKVLAAEQEQNQPTRKAIEQ